MRPSPSPIATDQRDGGGPLRSIPVFLTKPILFIKQLWSSLRRLTGDDAYERYLEHWRDAHGNESQPLSPRSFHHQEIKRKWDGVRRCC